MSVKLPNPIDELGFVPLSKTGAELLFELISQRYERGATL
ncbi:IstB-like ATP binding protein, partial [Rhizobium sp. BK376]